MSEHLSNNRHISLPQRGLSVGMTKLVRRHAESLHRPGKVVQGVRRSAIGTKNPAGGTLSACHTQGSESVTAKEYVPAFAGLGSGAGQAPDAFGQIELFPFRKAGFGRTASSGKNEHNQRPQSAPDAGVLPQVGQQLAKVGRRNVARAGNSLGEFRLLGQRVNPPAFMGPSNRTPRGLHAVGDGVRSQLVAFTPSAEIHHDRGLDLIYGLFTDCRHEFADAVGVILGSVVGQPRFAGGAKSFGRHRQAGYSTKHIDQCGKLSVGGRLIGAEDVLPALESNVIALPSLAPSWTCLPSHANKFIKSCPAIPRVIGDQRRRCNTLQINDLRDQSSKYECPVSSDSQSHKSRFSQHLQPTSALLTGAICAVFSAALGAKSVCDFHARTLSQTCPGSHSGQAEGGVR